MDHDPQKEKPVILATQMQSVRGSRIGYDFIAAILGCTFIGWLIDRFCGTKPWAVIIMVIVGFVMGIYIAWQSLSQKKPD